MTEGKLIKITKKIRSQISEENFQILKGKIQRQKKVPQILKKRKITETSKGKALEAGILKTEKLPEVAGMIIRRVERVTTKVTKVKSMPI